MIKTHAMLVIALLGACTSSHDTRPASDAGVDASASHDAGAARACAQPSDCVVVSAGCCGSCGRPSLADVTAIREDALPSRRERCKDMLCPKCAETLNPSLIATCEHGLCEVVDIEASDAISGCERDEDCRVRVSSCCECGGDTQPWALVAIAIAGEQAFSAVVCDEPSPGCPECAPIYPDNVSAVCDSTAARCRAQIAQ